MLPKDGLDDAEEDRDDGARLRTGDGGAGDTKGGPALDVTGTPGHQFAHRTVLAGKGDGPFRCHRPPDPAET